MKTTSKILIALALFPLTVAIVFIIIARISYDPQQKNQWETVQLGDSPENSIWISLPQKTIICTKVENLKNDEFHTYINLTVSSPTDKEETSKTTHTTVIDKTTFTVDSTINNSTKEGPKGMAIRIPKELKNTFRFETKKDTLFFILNGDYRKNLNKNQKNLFINLVLAADEHLHEIGITEPYYAKLFALTLPKLKINVIENSVSIENCNIKKLTYKCNKGSGNLDIRKLTSDSLCIDLDNIGNWSIQDSEIKLEQLTGSGHHSTNYSPSEAKRLEWIPKTSNARLNVNTDDNSFTMQYTKNK